MDTFEALHYHLKQYAANIDRGISIDLCTEYDAFDYHAEYAIIIKHRLINSDRIEIRSNCISYFSQFFPDLSSRRAEWSDPNLLEILEGWMRELITPF